MSLRALNWFAAAVHASAAVGVTLAFNNKAVDLRTVTTYRDGITALPASSSADATLSEVPASLKASKASLKASKASTEASELALAVSPLVDKTVDGCTSVNYPLTAIPVATYDPLRILQFYFGLSAAAHAFYAVDPGHVYSNAVKAGNNSFRWIEYGLSAGSMGFLIALLDGNRNQNAALMAAGSIAGLNLLGNCTEALLMQGPRHDYFLDTPFGKSPPKVMKSPLYTATLVAWFLLFMSFFTTLYSFKQLLEDVKRVQPDGPQPPSWLAYVGFSQLAFFCLFGTVQIMQLKEFWKQEARMEHGEAVFVQAYEHYEKIYIVLSLAAKLTLGGFVATGLLQQTAACTPT